MLERGWTLPTSSVRGFYWSIFSTEDPIFIEIKTFRFNTVDARRNELTIYESISLRIHCTSLNKHIMDDMKCPATNREVTACSMRAYVASSDVPSSWTKSKSSCLRCRKRPSIIYTSSLFLLPDSAPKNTKTSPPLQQKMSRRTTVKPLAWSRCGGSMTRE